MYKNAEVDVPHILLGLFLEEEGFAARVLKHLGFYESDLRILMELGSHEQATTSLPFTDAAKTVLELALREALSLGHNYIGTEHILLGVARDSDGVWAEEFALEVREETIRMLSEPTDKRPAQSVKAKPFIVSFEIEPGQVWIDRMTGESWYVKLAADQVHLERTIVTMRESKAFVREFRQMGEE